MIIFQHTWKNNNIDKIILNIMNQDDCYFNPSLSDTARLVHTVHTPLVARSPYTRKSWTLPYKSMIHLDAPLPAPLPLPWSSCTRPKCCDHLIDWIGILFNLHISNNAVCYNVNCPNYHINVFVLDQLLFGTELNMHAYSES